jgi:hypothetical protein
MPAKYAILVSFVDVYKVFVLVAGVPLVEIAAKNPFAYAQHFDMRVKSFFADIIGWVQSELCSIVGGGVFGYPKAYTGTVEEQGRKNLHIHCLIWIIGLCTNEAEQAVKLNDAVFKEKFKAFAQSIRSQHIGPDFYSDKSACDNTACPSLTDPTAAALPCSPRIKPEHCQPTCNDVGLTNQLNLS